MRPKENKTSRPAPPQSSSESASTEGTSVPDVRLTGLTKRYGDFSAVDAIDLEIQPGEFFTLLGPSGSGKTTTLKMIAGFEEPDSGTVELAGRDVGGLAPYDREVNTVFQDYALFPHMSVAENIEYGLEVAKVAKGERKQRVSRALEMVRLTDHDDRKPSELSGGQRQRVALARAIVNRPRVLLLDEPLGALDLKLREQMQVELKQIQSDVDITFVYVTHDQDEALTMSDRIAVFNQGRIEQVSAPRDLYEHPVNEFVADFVGISNALDRNGKRFTIRPEKIRLLGADESTDGLDTESGRISEIAYVGMVTRIGVALDSGGTIQLARQNIEAESSSKNEAINSEVTVGWRPDHIVPIQPQIQNESSEEKSS
ncbi:MAG: ABC transporter ATP-binding protein [Thermoleophilia bacterium]|nr:ABC transporter ATP-binding protein [Thermoleophilia bacterium]